MAPRACPHLPVRQRGVTLLALLFVMALMAMAYAAAALLAQTTLKREREAELLFVGAEYRRAISAYFAASPPAARQFPRALEDLLFDPRYPDTRRYLRKLYADPMTRGLDWGLMKGPDGSITGVYSRSGEAPIKRANFPFASLTFSQAKRYSDWKFAAAGSAPAAHGPQNAGAAAPGTGAGASSQPAPGGPRVAAAAEISPAALESRPECVALLASDRAACAARGARDGERALFFCEAYIPARLAACMQKRPLPALVVGP